MESISFSLTGNVWFPTLSSFFLKAFLTDVRFLVDRYVCTPRHTSVCVCFLLILWMYWPIMFWLWKILLWGLHVIFLKIFYMWWVIFSQAFNIISSALPSESLVRTYLPYRSGFVYFNVSWASWMFMLISFITLGNISAILFSNNHFVLLSLISFWNSHNIGLLDGAYNFLGSTPHISFLFIRFDGFNSFILG